MSLKRRLLWALGALHGATGLLCGTLLWTGHRPWIFLLEGLLILSFWLFLRLVRSVTLPLEILADGSRFLAEGDFSHTFVPSSSVEANRLVELYNSLVARLRAERIRQQEQHFFLEQVLESTPAGMLTFSPDGALRYANPAALRMLGLGPREGLPRDVWQAMPEGVRAAWAGLEDGSATVITLPGGMRVRLGRSCTVEEGFPCAVMMLEDLTAELLRSERAAYGKLIRTLSHEINNSLGASQSLLQSCLEWAPCLPEGEREDFVQALSIVLERSRHLGQFMNGYADVVRLPAPVLRACDLRAVVGDLLVLQEADLQRRGIGLDTELEPGPWPVLIDRPQVEQALLNVLRNACDALEALPAGQGRIRIRGGSHLGRWTLEIGDNGPGLSPEALANLFTPFFTTRAGGQGIGLTLVRDILSRHGFGFSLENGPGGGALFRMWVEQGVVGP